MIRSPAPWVPIDPRARAAVAEHAAGPPVEARLAVERVRGESTVTSMSGSGPLRLLVPRARGPSVWVYTSNLGGGLVAGDQTRLRVSLGEGSRCFVGTQASTKVYHSHRQRTAAHATHATLASGSFLAWLPDPVQAFAGAVYSQRQTFHLDPGAGLVLVDSLGSGRVACGERWAFARIENRNEIHFDGECMFLDSMSLDHRDGPLTARHRLGRFNAIALLVLAGTLLEKAAARLLAAHEHPPVVRGGSLIAAASPLRHGALLRLAGESLSEVNGALRRHLEFVAEWLGDDPWVRKN